MDKQKIKIVIIIATAILAFVAIVVFLLGGKNKNSNEQETFIPSNVSLQKETKKEDIRNITGRVLSVDANVENIQIGLSGDRKLNLTTRAGEFSILKQGKQADGNFVNEIIGIFDVPKDQDVEIQYNGQTNELIMILVNKF